MYAHRCTMARVLRQKPNTYAFFGFIAPNLKHLLNGEVDEHVACESELKQCADLFAA